MGMIRFDEKNSTDFFVTVEKLPVSAHGGKRGDPYTIAGRNGTEYREDGTLSNYAQPYKVWLGGRRSHRNARQLSRAVASWLLSSREYCRLEDTYDPDYYRLARYAGPLNIEHELWVFGRATLEFDCKPEYYLKSGEQAVTLFENVDLVHDSHGVSATIHNPTEFDSAPLIRFTGTGSFVITKPAQHAADAMQIGVTLDNDNAQTIEIDCASYAVNYVETVAGVEMRSNASAAIRYLTTYPTLTRLAEGENIVRLEPFDVMHPAQLSKFEIIPRWWTA